MPRRTQRIPESQRGTVKVQLRLDPQAAEVLETVPSGGTVVRKQGVAEFVGD